MSYPILKPNSSWFTPTVSTIKRATITVINIVDSYTPSATPTDSWDASVAQDGGIMCYVEGTIITIAGNGSGRIIANEDSSYMFYGMTSLTSVDCGVLDTSNTTNMNYMFGYTSAMKLTSITFGEMFDTSKVTNFSRMFERCTTIKNIDVSGFDVSSAITVEKMFNNCKALTYLDVSKWDTSNVENMCALFQQCNNLEELSVAHFNTSKVKNMGFVFYACKKFTKLDVEDWDVGNVETFDHFIANSGQITEFDTSKWNVSNKCKNLNAIFHSYKGESIDIRSWDTSNVEVFCQMFDGCSNLTEIKGLETLNTSNGKDFTQMFSSNKIKHLDLSSIDTTHAIPNYPLGANGTQGAGMYQFMYGNWKNLEKITLGKKFSFDGDGSCTLDTPSAGSPHCYFVFPESSSGKWYTIDGTEYASADIPSSTYNVYYSNEEGAIYGRDSKKYIHLAAMRQYHDMLSADIDTKIDSLREEMEDIEEISPEEIQALFSVSI